MRTGKSVEMILKGSYRVANKYEREQVFAIIPSLSSAPGMTRTCGLRIRNEKP
jgi:hypothetical protein